MANKKLVLAYSGGLDTSYCLMKLSKEGYEVHAVSVNTGGFDESQVKSMEEKALQMGAQTYQSIDALQSFYKCLVLNCSKTNSSASCAFPKCASVARNCSSKCLSIAFQPGITLCRKALRK